MKQEDTRQKILDKALELGADGVINGKEQDAVKALLEKTGGRGCDLAIETAGTEFTTRQCIQMTKKGARPSFSSATPSRAK